MIASSFKLFGHWDSTPGWTSKKDAYGWIVSQSHIIKFDPGFTDIGSDDLGSNDRVKQPWGQTTKG